MALQPSRPGFLYVGALIFLVLPFLWANISHEPVSLLLVALGIVIAGVCVALALQYRRQRRPSTDAPPAA